MTTAETAAATIASIVMWVPATASWCLSLRYINITSIMVSSSRGGGTIPVSSLTRAHDLEVRGARRENLKLAWEDAWNHAISEVVIAQVC